MAPTDTQLTGKALDERAAELEIEGRSEMNAEQKREAIAAKEAETDSGTNDNDDPDEGRDEDDPVRTLGEGNRAQNVREVLDEEPDEEFGVASPEENAELEHTMGGVTTRDDLTDQGVPMLQGDPEEEVGPEDAAGVGPKRGDYSERVLPNVGAHEVERIDGGTGPAGPQVTNEDGGIDNLPHSRSVPQAGRMADQGEEPGEKGGVDTDPRAA